MRYLRLALISGVVSVCVVLLARAQQTSGTATTTTTKKTHVTKTAAPASPSGKNEELLKMVKAGLPESVVLDRLRAGAGSWDHSTDALIEFKAAGATDAEIKALAGSLAPPPPPPPPVVVEVPKPPPPPPPVEFADGKILHTPAGDPFLHYNCKFIDHGPDGHTQEDIYLVMYEGKPALMVTEVLTYDRANTAFHNGYANMLFTQTSIIENVYAEEYKDKAMPLQKLATTVHDRAKLKPHYTKDGRLERVNSASVFTAVFVETDWSREEQQFIRAMIEKFPETLDAFMKAASITDPEKQLSPAAHYVLLKPDQVAKYIPIYQAQIDKDNVGKAPKASTADKLTNWTKVISTGARTLQASQSGDISGQVQAQQDYSQAVADAVGGKSGTAAEQANSSNAPGGASAADTANGGGLSSTGGAGSGTYQGIYADWVHRILATAGPYKCTKTGNPPVNKAAIQCQRDGYIAQAQQLAWGAECSEQLGFPDDSEKDAKLMMQTLQTAKSLCENQFKMAGAGDCPSERIIACSQLPK